MLRSTLGPRRQAFCITAVLERRRALLLASRPSLTHLSTPSPSSCGRRAIGSIAKSILNMVMSDWETDEAKAARAREKKSKKESKDKSKKESKDESNVESKIEDKFERNDILDPEPDLLEEEAEAVPKIAYPKDPYEDDFYKFYGTLRKNLYESKASAAEPSLSPKPTDPSEGRGFQPEVELDIDREIRERDARERERARERKRETRERKEARAREQSRERLHHQTVLSTSDRLLAFENGGALDPSYVRRPDDAKRFNALLELCDEAELRLPELVANFNSVLDPTVKPSGSKLHPNNRYSSRQKRLMTPAEPTEEQMTKRGKVPRAFDLPLEIRNTIDSLDIAQKSANRRHDLVAQAIRLLIKMTPVHFAQDLPRTELVIRANKRRQPPVIRRVETNLGPIPDPPEEFTEWSLIRYVHELVNYNYIAVDPTPNRFGTVAIRLIELFRPGNAEIKPLLSTRAYNLAILYFAEHKAPRQAVAFLADMLNADIDPDTKTLNYLLRACVQARNLYYATRILLLMDSLSVRADKDTWTLMLMIVNGTRLQVEVIRQMLLQGFVLDGVMLQGFFNEIQKYVPLSRILEAISPEMMRTFNLATLNSLLDRIVHADLATAWAFLLTATSVRNDLELTTATLNIFLRHLSANRRLERMLGILATFKKKYKVEPNARSFHYLFSCALKCGFHVNCNTVLEMLYGKLCDSGLKLRPETVERLTQAQLWFHNIGNNIDQLKVSEAPTVPAARLAAPCNLLFDPSEIYSEFPFRIDLTPTFEPDTPRYRLWTACEKYLAWPMTPDAYMPQFVSTCEKQAEPELDNWKERYVLTRALGLGTMSKRELRYCRPVQGLGVSRLLPLADERTTRSHWRGWSLDQKVLRGILAMSDEEFRERFREYIRVQWDKRQAEYWYANQAERHTSSAMFIRLRMAYQTVGLGLTTAADVDEAEPRVVDR
ncbi:hypothetical protein BZA70DRAFT_279373 [Myxozyma melibiosi]|uniref:Mitochondrial 15S rRNA processing factor CCM1 n=1 Tax=Myxozyma melibiosi TaxID=54550 RepID=A0ABR1F5V8_9ASCO